MANYDEYKIPKEKKEYTVVLEKKTRDNPAKEITWQNFKRTRVGRQGRENIMTTPGGPQGSAKDADTPLKSFLLFMSNDIIDHITVQTNKNISKYLASLSAEHLAKVSQQGSKYTHIRTTDQIEMKAFIGLFYPRGLFQQNNWSYRRVFAGSLVILSSFPQ